MTKRIHVLEPQVAELIAAGEVVERPASIVKELLENAVDAGAQKITIEIKNGGISYIRVTDDGGGIEKDDLPAAFVRHATSKVRTAADLEQIGSFGFRGEALASIAAVCKVEVLSRTPESISGRRYVIHGSQEVDFSDAGCPVGTTIVVRDVFFNTPARMKFLKKDSTEAGTIANIVDKIALANPQISFRFIRDGQVKLNTPGNGDLLSVIYAVYGKEFAADMIPVNYTHEFVTVSGFICRPTASRSTRSMQNFFINSRYVAFPHLLWRRWRRPTKVLHYDRASSPPVCCTCRPSLRYGGRECPSLPRSRCASPTSARSSMRSTGAARRRWAPPAKRIPSPRRSRPRLHPVPLRSRTLTTPACSSV